MLAAPTEDELKSVFVLERGQMSAHWNAVLGLIEKNLTAVQDRMIDEQDHLKVARLQGQARALKDILALPAQAAKIANK